MKDTLTEMKNNLQGINSRVHEAENQISDLEYKEQKTPNQNSKKKKLRGTDKSVVIAGEGVVKEGGGGYRV